MRRVSEQRGSLQQSDELIIFKITSGQLFFDPKVSLISKPYVSLNLARITTNLAQNGRALFGTHFENGRVEVFS